MTQNLRRVHWHLGKPSPTSHPALIHVNISDPFALTLCSAAPEAAPITFQFRKCKEEVRHASEEASFDQVSDSCRDFC